MERVQVNRVRTAKAYRKDKEDRNALFSVVSLDFGRNHGLGRSDKLGNLLRHSVFRKEKNWNRYKRGLIILTFKPLFLQKHQ